MTDAPRYTYRHADRLHGQRAFAAVFEAKMRKHAGPLTVFTRPNDAGRHRLGLSVGRRVGNAVKRNRVKRLLREAFRLHRHGWPGAYDVVVSVRPHRPLTVRRYAGLLADAVAAADRAWSRRDPQV